MIRMLVVAFFLLIPNMASAARFGHSSVFTGGENNTELIHLTVYLEKDDPEIQIVLRAFLITGEGFERQSMVESRKPEHADQDKKFYLSQNISPEIKDGELMDVRSITFSLNLADLNIPSEKSLRFGYGFYAFDAKTKQFLFTAASSLEEIKIEGDSIKIPREPLRFNAQFGETEAMVIGNDGGISQTEHKVFALEDKTQRGKVDLKTFGLENQKRAEKEPNPLRGASAPSVLSENYIYFATNRVINQTRTGGFEFLSRASAKANFGLSYGRAVVNVPTRAEEKSWWNKKKASMSGTQILGENKFFTTLSSGSDTDLFLFVHGYCNSLESSVIHTGRLKRDLDFKGEAIAFSWPSAYDVSKYSQDEKASEDSVDALHYMLVKLIETAKKKNSKLYILAHSMGNRILVKALRNLYKENKDFFSEMEKRIGVVAFAAPDVDINIFSSIIPNVVHLADQVSFYYTSLDRALKLSDLVHNPDRAGLHPLFHDEMETINTDAVNGWFSLGHNYYSESDPVIFDLYLQVKKHLKAAQRIPPLEKDVNGSEAFQFTHWLMGKTKY